MIDARLRLRHLRCFLETARLGSLTAAAQTLRISQPAASKTIRELEDILGRELFDRSARRLSLTEAGRIFQQHAGAGVIELTRAQDLVRSAPKTGAKIAAGVLPTAATELMPTAALALRKAYPTCTLRVSTGPNWLLMSQLREGSLDLVVGRMGNAKVMAGLSFTPLYSDRITCIMRPGHPLVGCLAPLDELGNYPLIIPPAGAVIAPMVRALLNRNGITADAQAFETVSLAFGRKVVQLSDALWFISRGVVQNELDNGELIELEIPDNPLGAPVGISLREDGKSAPEQSALIAAIEGAARDRFHSTRVQS